MKDYKIHIDEDLDIKSRKILNDYWVIQNGNFSYKSKEITQMHDIAQGDLTKLVKKYSHCEIIHGNCRECNEEMKEKITSKTDYASAMRDKIHTCTECRLELRRKAEKEYQDRLEEIRKKKRAYFDKAVNEKKWTELPKNELIILYKLIQNKTKSRIYANVFEGDSHSRSMWGHVNKFEGMGLLCVIRNGGSVIEFEFDERINEAIKNLFLKKTDKDMYSDSSASNILGFSLTRKEYKKTDRDPDYGGTFTLPGEIILKANIKYIFGGWIQTDGSINLRFTPLANLHRNNVIQENIENEPQLVGDIVKNMFNEIRELPTYDQVLDAIESDSYEDEDDDWDVPF